MVKETYYRVVPKRESEIEKTNSMPKIKFVYANPKYENMSPYKPLVYTGQKT